MAPPARSPSAPPIPPATPLPPALTCSGIDFVAVSFRPGTMSSAPPPTAHGLAEPSSTAPRLWDRFALLGACVGALSALCLESPGVGLRCPPGLTSACAAGACLLAAWCYGAAVGDGSPVARVERWLDAHGGGLLGSRAGRWAAASLARAVWLGAILGAAGAATGLVVGLAAGAPTGRIGFTALCVLGGAAVGALCGLVALPLFQAVVRASLRPRQTRGRSLVSGCERRSVWVTASTWVGVATLSSVPAWIDHGAGTGPRPLVAELVLLGCVLVLCALGMAEIGVALRLRSASRHHARAEVVDAQDADQQLDAIRMVVDFGQGDAMRGVVQRGNPYRERERLRALWRGDPATARRLVRSKLGTIARRLLVLATVLGLQQWAALPSSALVAYRLRCEAGSATACYRGYTLVREGRATPASPAVGERLARRACALGVRMRWCSRDG
jgi:hypothetical protein